MKILPMKKSMNIIVNVFSSILFYLTFQLSEHLSIVKSLLDFNHIQNQFQMQREEYLTAYSSIFLLEQQHSDGFSAYDDQ